MKCAISLSIKPEYNTWGDFLFKEYSGFFKDLGIKVVYVPNGISGPDLYIKELSLDGLILSGGNDVIVDRAESEKYKLSAMRNLQEKKMLNLAIKMKIPVLGICRGMQFINYYFGGAITKDVGAVTGSPSSHAKTVHPVNIEDARLVSLLKKKTTKVNSYHRQGLFGDQVSPHLRIAARSSADDVIEALYHPSLPIMGMQWHPERKGGDRAAGKKIVMAFKNRACYWSGR